MNCHVMKQIFTLLLMLMGVCGAVAQNTSRDYKSSLDFSAWKASFAVGRMA